MSFIVFEGCDLTGKSEQARLLGEHLKKNGRKCLLSREPGGSERGEVLRRALAENRGWSELSKALLFYAARAEHIKTLREKRKEGFWLVLDRFYLSTMVYQRLVGKKLLEALRTAVVGDFEPSLWIILDAPFAAVAERKASRAADDLADNCERTERSDWEELRGEYLRLAEEMPEAAVVDATAPKRRVAAAVRRVVAERLGTPP